mmetsp:Transcript_9382/g.13883  ORF Transcript_9382/g.13883 Transcript_9382/m.13883 type:complete len:287 (-) Transcript_9382:695-1555(-)
MRNERTNLLIIAIEKEDIKLLDELIERDKGILEIPIRGRRGNNALHEAAQIGNTEIIDRIIKGGVKVDGKNYCMETGIHIAATEGNLKAFKRLMREGEAEKVWKDKNNWGCTIVHNAVEWDNIDILNEIIETNKYGNLLEEKNKFKQTPTHLAAKHGRRKTLERLITCNVNVNEEDEDGNIPIHMAVGGGKTQIVDLLIEKSDLNKQNKKGDTPLHMAVSTAIQPIIEILLKQKVKVNIQNREGQTPLMFAAFIQVYDIVRTLIENEANLYMIDKEGKSSLHLAIY